MPHKPGIIEEYGKVSGPLPGRGNSIGSAFWRAYCHGPDVTGGLMGGGRSFAGRAHTAGLARRKAEPGLTPPAGAFPLQFTPTPIDPMTFPRTAPGCFDCLLNGEKRATIEKRPNGARPWQLWRHTRKADGTLIPASADSFRTLEAAKEFARHLYAPKPKAILDNLAARNLLRS